jgi:hypothetical protein
MAIKKYRGKRPLLDPLRPVFPQPEMNQAKKDEQRPQEMHSIHLVPFRVLDDARHSAEETRNTQAKKNGE